MKALLFLLAVIGSITAGAQTDQEFYSGLRQLFEASGQRFEVFKGEQVGEYYKSGLNWKNFSELHISQASSGPFKGRVVHTARYKPGRTVTREDFQHLQVLLTSFNLLDPSTRHYESGGSVGMSTEEIVTYQNTAPRLKETILELKFDEELGNLITLNVYAPLVQ